MRILSIKKLYPPPRFERRACRIVCGVWWVVSCFLWKLVIRGSQDPCGTVARSVEGAHPGASKTHLFFIIFSMRFLIDFWSLLARFSLPTWLPKPTKIHQKSMPRRNPSWASIFGRFLIDFWCQLRSQKLEKSLNNLLFFNSFCKIGLSKLASIFDPILVPTCLRFPSKNPPKTHQNCDLEGIISLIDFCIDFLSIFLRFGRPAWGYVGP